MSNANLCSSPPPEKVRETATPLESLSEALAADMEAVNAVIVAHMKADVPLIPRLAGYLIASGGKRIRPLLTVASARLLGYCGPEAHALAGAVEFIHTATLLHDDVVDGSTERRGKAAANLVFGNTASVLVGDFLFSRAFQLMVAQGSLEVLRILSEASAIIAEGEVMQLSAINDIATDWNRYSAIVEAKTAALFAAACEIGPVLADAGPALQAALRSYGRHLGIAFQIADDVLDYEVGLEAFGKVSGNDFAEGKMTAPVILALEKADGAERAFWKRTLGDRQQQPGDLDEARAIIGRHGAAHAALDKARTHAGLAAEALRDSPGGPLKESLKDLAFYAVERQR